MTRRKRNRNSSRSMQIINPNAAGIDLGSDLHWVCIPGTDDVTERVRDFSTDTASLKELDMMNIRVHKAVSGITGATGMRMLQAIVDGERDPAPASRPCATADVARARSR